MGEWMLNTWWEGAQNVFNFASNNYASWNKAIATVPDSKFEPLWNFCNGNGGDDITGDELVACGKKAAEFAELPDGYSNYVYEFGSKYFNTVDPDGSGTLSKSEFRDVVAGFAAVDARVIMRGFDANELKQWTRRLMGMPTRPPCSRSAT